VDTVFDRDFSDRPQSERNGYVFHGHDNATLEAALSRAIGLWNAYPADFRALVLNGMRQDHSWADPGQHYLNIYEYIAAHKPPAPAAEPSVLPVEPEESAVHREELSESVDAQPEPADARTDSVDTSRDYADALREYIGAPSEHFDAPPDYVAALLEHVDTLSANSPAPWEPVHTVREDVDVKLEQAETPVKQVKPKKGR